ncbi:MAG: hypothetical protein A2Z20_10260 [Bdellovibrionales bacterium RBG_16_40_8]|nr:MAG: hypothetical protein A2Z20_10260 [Bdellovibrionales bacterium RBG_16_40_8]
MFSADTTILIVDDMMVMRKLVKQNLINLGLSKFDEASDGQKAWDKLNTQPGIGLVISDWNMPNCTGIELLKRIRSDARFKNLPFILLTAEGEMLQITEAVAAGVDNYIIKPFTLESLKDKLEQVHKKCSAA